MEAMPRLTARPVVLLAVLVMLAKIITSTPRLDGGTAPEVMITWATVAAFLVVGLLLFETGVPPANAWACLAVAAATIPGDLVEAYYAPLWLTPVGFVAEQLYLPAAAALVLRYPMARLTDCDRQVVGLLLVTAVALRVPIMFTEPARPEGFIAPAGWPTLAGSAAAHDVLVEASLIGTAGGLLWAATRLVGRVMRARGLERESILAVCVIGALVATSAAVTQLFWLWPTTYEWRQIPATVRDLIGIAIPVALLGDLLRRRTAGSAVAVRVVAAAQSGSADRLRDAIAEALADPTVEVWLAAAGSGWVRSDGERVEAVSVAPGRLLQQIRDEDGADLCALTVDARAVRDGELLASAVRAVRLGLENDRLRAELLARMAELRRSRERIVEETAAERRRLERDLHDGAQQQLLAVAAALSRAGLLQDTEGMRHAVADARTRLAAAIAELRRLARGIHPASLSQGGLAAALPGLAEGAGVPTKVVLADAVVQRRFRPAVESTVYFVVAEALANAVRHAGATAVRVEVDGADEAVTVLVTDDGRGGARVRPGGGLAGLADRVHALGGTLEVHSDNGTVVRAWVPAGRQERS